MVVGLAGAAISLAALPFSSVRATTGRTSLAVALLLLHLGACTAYYYYVQTNPADSATYYFDTRQLGSRELAFGTLFTVHFTQFLRNGLGGSYFETFILFQSIGFWGIMILMRVFQEIHIKMKSQQNILPYYLLFLPSLHFWTVAIGKDAPIFFAISLCFWSVLSLKKRIIWFALSLLVMVLFRAYVALIVMTSLAAAAALHRGLSLGRRGGLLFLSLIGAVILSGAVEETFGIDPTSATDVQSLLTDTEFFGGGWDLREQPFPIRMLSLLFRPFFFDAEDIFGIVASLENVGSLMLLLYFITHWRSIRYLAGQVFFIRFCIVFSLVMIFLLAMIYYNVGLGLRQRVMVFPALFSIFVAQWAMSRGRVEVTSPQFSGELSLKGRRIGPLAGHS